MEPVTLSQDSAPAPLTTSIPSANSLTLKSPPTHLKSKPKLNPSLKVLLPFPLILSSSKSRRLPLSQTCLVKGVPLTHLKLSHSPFCKTPHSSVYRVLPTLFLPSAYLSLPFLLTHLAFLLLASLSLILTQLMLLLQEVLHLRPLSSPLRLSSPISPLPLPLAQPSSP